jgi:glycine/D-amino acid oxidase-like deaminating enzyme
MTRSTHDVVIVGGGIMGMSIAYQVAQRSSLRVVVLEKGAGLGDGSTGSSSAVTRQRYSRIENVRISRGGNAAFAAWGEFTGLAEPRGRYHPIGVVWITGDGRDAVEADAARLGPEGVDVEVLGPLDLRARFPALSACVEPFDLTGEQEHECRDGEAFLVENNAGFFDATGALEDLAEAAQREGVELRMRTEVVDVIVEADRVSGVRLADGSRLDGPVVINAAGPWCNRINAMAGLEISWDLVPTRVQILYRDLPSDVPRPIPVVGDLTSGVYFRPEAGDQQIILGSTKEEDEMEEADPDDYSRAAERAFLDEKVHALHHRIPALPHRGTLRGMAGLYTVNRQDVHPVVGPTSIEGFVVCNGFSGHGFKESPMVGSMVAQWLTGERTSFDTDVPIGFFSIDRIPIAGTGMNVLA